MPVLDSSELPPNKPADVAKRQRLRTDLEIRTAVCRNGKATKYTVDNGPFKGLFLQVEPSGSKYWRYRYRLPDGREHLAALGVYPVVTLADARRAHEAAVRSLNQGVDPVEQKRRDAQAAIKAAASTFEVVCRTWHQARRNKWTPDNAVRILRRLEQHLFPDLGRLPVAEVTARQVLATLRKIEAQGSFETARRCLQYTSGALRLALWDGHVSTVVTDAIPVDALTSPSDRHHTRVNPDEIGALLRAVDAAELRHTTYLALQLVFLTAVRTAEAREARWVEFDLDSARWAIPAERMKMNEAHIVPLSTQAVAVLRELARHTGGGVLLFPNQARPLAPMSENTMLYALNRAGYAGRQTVHGIRGLFSTVANESGEWDADVIELSLAHKPTNAVRSAYNSAKRLADRTRLMQWWADYLDRARSGATVLQLAVSQPVMAKAA